MERYKYAVLQLKLTESSEVVRKDSVSHELLLWFISLWVFGFVLLLMTLSLFCVYEMCRPSDSTADHLSLCWTIAPDYHCFSFPTVSLGEGEAEGR